jgi:NitT/TauT family transport system ATP-binding protein
LDFRDTLTDIQVIGELRHISKSYTTNGGREYKVLDQIDLAVREGELLALLGQSGSGKSTILRCLTGLLKPTAGRVLCYGKPLDGAINPHASIVFQTFALYPWLTVEQNVAVGLMAKRLSRSEKQVAIDKVIELIGLTRYHRSYPRQLSGGMRQRVGLARALVSEPKMLCLDEAFSALDVLTAETLRHEIIALWQKHAANLKSIFMVTHNIEEAVEMATRICILLPHPGRLGLILENKLPYPRDAKSPEFQRLVDTIHETITTLTLPDHPPEPPPAPGQLVSRARRRMESIPLVTVGQILGLISILYDGPQPADIYEISDEIEKDFGETIGIVKAAEILELVDTPKNEVQLTALGRRFHEGSRAERQKIFSEQLYKLRLFHIILAYLEVSKEVDAERVLQDITHALPHENPEKVLETMIAWGRYAGILDYNPTPKTLFAPHDQAIPRSRLSRTPDCCSTVI